MVSPTVYVMMRVHPESAIVRHADQREASLREALGGTAAGRAQVRFADRLRRGDASLRSA
jgi:hypothetical protein